MVVSQRFVLAETICEQKSLRKSFFQAIHLRDIRKLSRAFVCRLSCLEFGAKFMRNACKKIQQTCCVQSVDFHSKCMKAALF